MSQKHILTKIKHNQFEKCNFIFQHTLSQVIFNIRIKYTRVATSISSLQVNIFLLLCHKHNSRELNLATKVHAEITRALIPGVWLSQ